MTDKQPDALFYADKLEKVFGLDDYAIEMRRLHEENQRWEEAVAAEREACAKVCEEVGEHPSLTPRHCAEAIRVRGQHD